ncbi:MAG: hypothetical protein QW279_15700 [Candidatus Jordarchaeaceae archaeon]
MTCEAEPSKSLVHIKMKVGNVEFEMDCREDRVQEMVQKVLASITEYANKAVSVPVEKQSPLIRADTCRDIVERLWKEGFFSEPKLLSDVHEEMIRIGYHFDRTAVSHVLRDMVRDNIITREGKPRGYLYVQKRPPTQL